MILIFSFCICFAAAAQTTNKKLQIIDISKALYVVEVSCGECQFHLAGKTCDLAIRLNGKAYFIEGTTIDEHGDAHAKDGFCEAIRKAEVQGEIKGDKYKVSYFKLLPGN